MSGSARKPLRVVFRADASVEIGTGHVMRCLTLADALRADGATCRFLCRAHAGHLLELIAARGHEAVALPLHETGRLASDSALPAHAHWLGTDWGTDVVDSRAALGGAVVDWLVVDHYALDRHWEAALRPNCRRLFAIDDLADRPHNCDLLLDQNLGRRAEDYRDLLPAGAQTLIGPAYALLRPEFAALRGESLERRAQPEFRQLLITMGGVDKDNATGAVLDALADCTLPADLRITVVLGPQAPALFRVRERATTLPWHTEVRVGVTDMAALMTNADLAIGSGGGGTWERLFMGLPTLVIPIADNQAQYLKFLDAEGYVGYFEDGAGLKRQLACLDLQRFQRLDAIEYGTEKISSIICLTMNM